MNILTDRTLNGGSNRRQCDAKIRINRQKNAVLRTQLGDSHGNR